MMILFISQLKIHPVGIYSFKINNEKARIVCEIFV